MGLALLAFLAAGRAAAQTRPTRYETELRPYVERFMRTQDIPGLAIAVVQDGRVVYAQGFGVQTVNASVVPAVFPPGTRTAGPITTRSLFHLASVTKPFVATAVLQLVSAGRLALDTPVVRYLPAFTLADGRYRAITVRQLLNHTSGLPDRTGIRGHGWDHPQTDDAALARFVASLAPDSLSFAPGARFRYSNVGFEVLGTLVARISGETFEAYVHDHILRPLGMAHSTLLPPARDGGLWVTGHETDDAEEPQPMRVYPFNRAQSPSSGLVSDLDDMVRYAVACLNRGAVGGGHLLPAAAYDTLWAPSTGTGDDGAFAHYGLGWYVGTSDGARIVSHTGRDLGFMADLALLPEQRIAVVWMMNAGWANGALALRNAALAVARGRPIPVTDVRRDLPAVLAGDLERGRDIDWVLRKYADLRTRKAATFDFAEPRMELLGDYLRQRRRVADAVAVYRVNAQAFPASAHALEKLGDAQLAVGDSAAARTSYEAALTRQPADTALRTKLQAARRGPRE